MKYLKKYSIIVLIATLLAGIVFNGTIAFIVFLVLATCGILGWLLAVFVWWWLN
jgi:hypothetical protein